ncbi:MAG: clpXP degradation system adaptor protein SspB [Idiomarinaceae bacterium HL-53]|nr:MAG: clpXP degradation system adaptor protein SspB [Idiomarinaceae bacterium HL-53]CUS47409.1 stringent starvation protein B [Idiomarinaceae bacterium HL-53]
MTPKRPYLARALYEWLLDNQMTPHIVIDANWPDTEVPLEFVQDGQIVLNIHPEATTSFEMSEFDVRFQARFGGVPRKVVVPYGALLAIYARENGAGSIFEPEPYYDEPEMADGQGAGEPSDEPPKPPKGRPNLKVIK